MKHADRIDLQSQLAFFKRQLAELPESAWMTRGTAQSRVEEIEAELAAHPVDEREPARVRLTFKGRPVVGSHGVAADFGGEAVRRFTEAVTTMAASLHPPTRSSKPPPNQPQYPMIITGTALGSFGFELEEHRTGQLSLDELTPVAEAIDRTQRLLQSTLGTDEELADSAFEIDVRALDKVRAFLKTLTDAEAVCTVTAGESQVQFTEVEQVRRSYTRLAGDNLRETEETLAGSFQGVLPKSRAFEFKLTEGGQVVRGKVGPTVEDVDALNQLLQRPVRLKVMVTRVGEGRPRYLLLEPPTVDAVAP